MAPGVVEAAATLLLLGAPVAVIWLVALQLRDGAANRAARSALLADQAAFTERRLERSGDAVAALEDRLDRLATRIDAIASPLAERQSALAAASSALDASGARLSAIGASTEAAAALLGKTTPAAIAQAETLQALLETTTKALGDRLAETETLLAGLHVGAADADAQTRAAAAGAAASLAALSAAAAAHRRRWPRRSQPAGRCRCRLCPHRGRHGRHARRRPRPDQCDAGQRRPGEGHPRPIGGEAARQIEVRLQTLLGSAGALDTEITAQSQRANALIDDVSRGFTVLDAKLANSATTGTGSLEAITAG